MSKSPLTLQELQNLEFEILQAFHDFCEKNNLRYYLGGGTLIGAIRHKGFIPWDDDIDLMMPRPDYDKLIELTQKEHKLDEYRSVDYMYFNDNALTSILRIFDNRTELTFTNYRVEKKFGCWIDIFPIDGLSDSFKKRKKQFKKARILQDALILNDTKFGAKRRSKLATVLQYGLLPALPFVYMVGHERWIRKLDKLSKKYDYETATYVGVLEGRAGYKEAMLKENLEPAILVDFWGKKFYAMANYHEYLTNLYGDYMTPPENPVSRHEIDVYWKEQ